MCSVSVAFCAVTASCGVSRNRVVCRWGLSAIVSTRYRTRQAQDWVVSTSAEAFARTFHDSSCKQCRLSVLVFNCHMRTLSNKAAISRRLSPRREESRVIASSVASSMTLSPPPPLLPPCTPPLPSSLSLSLLASLSRRSVFSFSRWSVSVVWRAESELLGVSRVVCSVSVALCAVTAS